MFHEMVTKGFIEARRLDWGSSGSMDLLRDPTLTPSGWDLDQGA